ncbi:hypothetical protein L1987_02373 [Smallanthus sonchifolius]|uniref:Uncharacterized protein n=1 Tax=Smallanthus sonchifolius TaxID=185202 RepID=A0ACB9K7T8_9ASTR|nr:hypothetical protein L1987_02373 [Smallanthus sonchifolius]
MAENVMVIFCLFLIMRTPAPRCDHTVVVHVDRYFLIFGGCSHSTFFNDMHVLDLETAGWKSSNKEPSLRSVLSDSLSGAFLEDAVFAPCGHSFGGMMLKRVIETVDERYLLCIYSSVNKVFCDLYKLNCFSNELLIYILLLSEILIIDIFMFASNIQQVYIIDYGLAKKYRDLQMHRHIPYMYWNRLCKNLSGNDILLAVSHHKLYVLEQSDKFILIAWNLITYNLFLLLLISRKTKISLVLPVMPELIPTLVLVSDLAHFRLFVLELFYVRFFSITIHLGDCLWKERNNTVLDCAFIGADHWKHPRTFASPEAIQDWLICVLLKEISRYECLDEEIRISSKLRYFSDYKLGIKIPARRESSDLLHAEEEKNDYEWLLTPGYTFVSIIG